MTFIFHSALQWSCFIEKKTLKTSVQVISPRALQRLYRGEDWTYLDKNLGMLKLSKRYQSYFKIDQILLGILLNIFSSVYRAQPEQEQKSKQKQKNTLKKNTKHQLRGWMEKRSGKKKPQMRGEMRVERQFKVKGGFTQNSRHLFHYTELCKLVL